MTTANAPVLNPTTLLDDGAQILIDSRLDTIERMLLGQVPRADRLAIVREVEAQIHDLLADRTPDDTDRDAVLAALGRLDPPEAYLPDEAGSRMMPTSTTPPAQHSRSGCPVAGSLEPGTTGFTLWQGQRHHGAYRRDPVDSGQWLVVARLQRNR